MKTLGAFNSLLVEIRILKRPPVRPQKEVRNMLLETTGSGEREFAYKAVGSLTALW